MGHARPRPTEEDQVAQPRALLGTQDSAGEELVVSIARQSDTDPGHRLLYETRTVEPEGCPSTPKVRDPAKAIDQPQEGAGSSISPP